MSDQKNDISDTKLSKNDTKCTDSLTIVKAQSLVADFDKAIKDSGWLKSSEDSWKRFKQEAGARKVKRKRFPLWYSTAKIRQPLVFSKVPEIVVQPIVPDKEGFVTEVASVAEKLGNVLLEQFPFFSVARSSSDDNLLTSMGVSRVLLDAEFVDEPKKEYLEVVLTQVMGPQGPVQQEVAVDKQGQPVNPQLVMFDNDGKPYIELEEMERGVRKARAILKSVCYKDFIWDWEARDFAEWEYGGFKSQLTKRQIVERFGQEALEKLPKDDQVRDARSKGKRRKYEIIELWWKPSRERYIFAKGAEDFLKVSKDPLKLQGFFPFACPLFTNLDSEDSIPFPEYDAVRDILDHIDDIYDRKAQAVRVSRPRGLYDSNIDELSIALQNTRTSQKDWIGVPNLATKAQQGSTFTQTIDTTPVLNALNTYRTEFAEQLQAYDQITRLSDSVRGVTNPYESATATERKAQSVNHGIIDQQQDMQRWCKDSLIILIDAALGNFSDDRLFELLSPTLTDAQRPIWGKIIKKLKTDSWRIISLDIETDSTILIDEDVDKQQAGELAQAIGSLLDRVKAMVDTAPEGVPLVAELIQFVVTKYRGGKEFQDKINKTIDGMMQAAQQRQAQAQQGPQPTPLEAAQIQAIQVDTQVKGMSQQLVAQKQQSEFHLKNRELDRKEFETQLEANQQAFEQMIARFELELEKAALTIEDFKARAQASESMAEEIRLAKDTEISQLRTMIEAQRPEMPKDAQAPMIINVPQVPQAGSQPKTILRTKQDTMGNVTQEIEESEEL